MDTALELADEYLLDSVYAKLFPTTHIVTSNNLTGLPTTPLWSRDSDLRIVLSLSVLVTLGGWFFYLAAASFSYYFVFDHETMKHPKFLKNQVRLEIECALKAVPGFSCKYRHHHPPFWRAHSTLVLYIVLTVPWFWGEVKGYSLLYDGLPTTAAGWAYMIATIPMFLFFTDFGIYWIHRWLHHPLLYKRLHKVKALFQMPNSFINTVFTPFSLITSG